MDNSFPKRKATQDDNQHHKKKVDLESTKLFQNNTTNHQNQNNNNNHRPMANQKKCQMPCASKFCYVCSPERGNKLHNYLFFNDPLFRSIFINQNLAGFQEFVIVPRHHVGQFRFLSQSKNESATNFFQQTFYFLKRMFQVSRESQKPFSSLYLEINYGDWIVHGSGCPHYHAHLHVHFSPYIEIAQEFKRRGVFSSNLGSRVKQTYPSDCQVEISFPLKPLPKSENHPTKSQNNNQSDKISENTGIIPEKLSQNSFDEEVPQRTEKTQTKIDEETIKTKVNEEIIKTKINEETIKIKVNEETTKPVEKTNNQSIFSMKLDQVCDHLHNIGNRLETFIPGFALRIQVPTGESDFINGRNFLYFIRADQQYEGRISVLL